MKLGKGSMRLGELLLFLGLLFFTLIFAAFSSGTLSHSFAQNSVSKIVNYTLAQDSLNSIVSKINTTGLAATVTSRLDSQISYINCGVGCFASSFIKDSTSVSIPMDNTNIFHYEIISLIAAILGVILIFFASTGEERFRAIGRNIVSMAIISIVIFYIPLTYIVPYFVSPAVASYSIHLPPTLFSSFSATLFLIDIVIIIIGVVLIIIAGIMKRIKQNPKQNLGTKLIVTQK